MHLSALLLAVAACVAIMAIGVRFLLAPQRAIRDFGVRADDVQALAGIKGIRDITSGAVPLVVWAAGGPVVLGWALIAAALTPTADAVLVLTRGGRRSTALGVHGVTALLLLAAGLVLVLGRVS